MMISLPAKWIKQFGLGKGDEIDLETSEDSIVISPETKKEVKKEIRITLDEENKKDLRNLLTHIYRKGFEKITITKIDINILNKIRKITDQLLFGFEITQADSDKCIIENISEPTGQKYEILLKRIFFIIKETHEIIEKDFKTNLKNMKEVEEIKNQHDKFILFCRRLLINNHQTNSLFEWELLTFLMHIEHSYYYLYKFAFENKIKPDKQITNLLEDLKEYFELFHNAYDKKDKKYIHQINKLKKEHHFGKINQLIEKSSGKNAVVYSYIKNIFRLIQISTSPVLSELIELELPK